MSHLEAQMRWEDRSDATVAMEGGDADTNGAVAGAMLGCLVGYERLDEEWKGELLHREWLEKKVDNLLILMGLKDADVEYKEWAVRT